jgi:hypothetical protein
VVDKKYELTKLKEIQSPKEMHEINTSAIIHHVISQVKDNFRTSLVK